LRLYVEPRQKPEKPKRKDGALKWILYAISILLIVLGTWANLYPVQASKRLRNLVERIAPRWSAIAALATGIMLLIAAPASNQGTGFVRLLGILGMVKGIVLFVMSRERYQRLLDWWFDSAKELSWRVWGLLMLVLGVVILSWL
jgi:hypothetical protein